jgi:hypothetical protein
MDPSDNDLRVSAPSVQALTGSNSSSCPSCTPDSSAALEATATVRTHAFANVPSFLRTYALL